MNSDDTTNPAPTSPIEEEQPIVEEPTKGSALFLKVLLVLVLLAGAGAGAAAYYYRGQVKQLRQVNPDQAAQAETAALIAKVSQLILLPADEQPTVATVADPEKLKNQPFFKNSHKGDKVLIYTNAKKAFLYDPVAHKIVEVAPVVIGSSETAGATTPTPQPSSQK